MAKTPDAAQAEVEEVPPQPAPQLTSEEFESRRERFQKVFEAETFDIEKVKRASCAERAASGQQDVASLTYGEMDVKTLSDILNVAKAEGEQNVPLCIKKGAFLDLGSGIGKPVIAAALLHPFEKVIGVECIECLHGLASEAKTLYEGLDPDPADEAKPVVEFIKGDMREEAAKIVAGDVPVVCCLAVATLFGVKDLNTMKEVATAMPENSLFITVTHMLPPPVVDHEKPKARPEKGGWFLIHEAVVEMPWGTTTCFAFKKEPAPKPEETAEDAAAKDPDAA